MSNIYLRVLFVSFILFQGCKRNGDSNESHKYTNALIHENSPYLLQHAHNPVDWKPWSDDALELAKKENKPLLISIGYSACHWCHVMEEESFKNDSIAKFMNEHFINIKVDREERPDIDDIYIDAVQLMTGKSGWPLNCFALPNGKPIYGGTYFSQNEWLTTLQKVHHLYKNQPEKLIDYSEKITAGLQQNELIKLEKFSNETDEIDFNNIVLSWQNQFDLNHGGFGESPKFPLPGALSTLLRYGYQQQNDSILDFVELSLDKIALGGIYDQIGGGFSRYTTDSNWNVPHFEKMLYDNAQLISLYSNAYRLNSKNSYKRVVNNTLTFIKNEMRGADGEHFSSIDADSRDKKGDLKEGTFYLWNKAELKKILKNDFHLFTSYYTLEGHEDWKNDKYILTKTDSDEMFSKKNGIPEDSLLGLKYQWNNILLENRNLRKKPAIDDKVLTSWNSLMIKAYVDAYKAFGDEEYLVAATATAEFILKYLRKADGSLFRSYRNGKTGLDGYAEDYAFTIEAFIALSEVSLGEKWILEAKILMDYALNNFYDHGTELFLTSLKSNTSLIAKKIVTTDDVLPSSNAIMAKNLHRLGLIFAHREYLEKYEMMTSTLINSTKEFPLNHYMWFDNMMSLKLPFYEVVIIGKEAKKKSKLYTNKYLPNTLLFSSNRESNIPLAKDKYVDQETYIYVCTHGYCKRPTTNITEALNSVYRSQTNIINN